jgi:hypothetical protein
MNDVHGSGVATKDANNDDTTQAIEFILIVSVVVFTIVGCAFLNCWIEDRRQAKYNESTTRGNSERREGHRSSSSKSKQK